MAIKTQLHDGSTSYPHVEAGGARMVRGKAWGKRPRRGGWSRYSNRSFFFFLSPWLLGFFGLTVFPLLYALAISFTNFDGLTGRWVGVANYVAVIRDPMTWFSLGRTALYTAIVVPVAIVGGLILALLVNRPSRLVGVQRLLFFLPSIVPVTAGALIWGILFDRDAGAVNSVLENLGGLPITWLVDPTAFLVLLSLSFWGIGGAMILSLAGLQGIPQELYEAARIDGANLFQTLRTVTLPLLTPIFFFQAVTGVIGSLQTLVQPLLLNSSSGNVGDIPRDNYLYMVNVYVQFFFNQRLGYSSALLWILFLVVLGVTLLVLRSSAFWVYYEVDQDKGD
jgi:multiple sugar transport system permease protein